MNIDLWYDLLSESEAEQKAFAEFQTKLTYGMICYLTAGTYALLMYQFQTKLTYVMICYANPVLIDHLGI